MLQLIKQIHGIANKENLDKTSEKSFLMLLSVNYLGHKINFNTNPPMQSKIAADHKFLSSTKTDSRRFSVQWTPTRILFKNFK